jgi:glycosyltransferase involved in cell wall biosynthesis
MLPLNVASFPVITCKALNKINGLNAQCITQSLNKYQQSSEDIIYLPREVPRKSFFKWMKHRFTSRRTLKALMKEADVIHYYWGPAYNNGLDLKWVRSLNKPVVIEWLGSDIRNPEVLKKYNPYFEKIYESGYEYRENESVENSQRVQQLFADIYATPVLCPEMSLFLDTNIFPSFKLLFQRIECIDFIPYYPDATKTRPLVIHSPSAIFAKGTNFILPVIEELKQELDFDFLLLHNVKRQEVLDTVTNADIIIDQVLIGGYGMAALEAMAQGKPVISYLMPAVFEAGLPAECPIVNSNIENLKSNLKRLITDGQFRYDIGVKSRAYVERYHDADKIAHQLVNIYKEVINAFPSKAHEDCLL